MPVGDETRLILNHRRLVSVLQTGCAVVLGVISFVFSSCSHLTRGHLRFMLPTFSSVDEQLYDLWEPHSQSIRLKVLDVILLISTAHTCGVVLSASWFDAVIMPCILYVGHHHTVSCWPSRANGVSSQERGTGFWSSRIPNSYLNISIVQRGKTAVTSEPEVNLQWFAYYAKCAVKLEKYM